MKAALFSTDQGPPDEECRIVQVSCVGESRLAVVSLSGGMMDLGWAHRVASPVSNVTARLVAERGTDFAAAVAVFVASLRATLTHSERVHRWWCSAQFTVLELSAQHCRLARLGGMRVMSFQAGHSKILGREDVMSLGPASPPLIATACLIPDVHWKAP